MIFLGKPGDALLCAVGAVALASGWCLRSGGFGDSGPVIAEHPRWELWSGPSRLSFALSPKGSRTGPDFGNSTETAPAPARGYKNSMPVMPPAALVPVLRVSRSLQRVPLRRPDSNRRPRAYEAPALPLRHTAKSVYHGVRKSPTRNPTRKRSNETATIEREACTVIRPFRTSWRLRQPRPLATPPRPLDGATPSERLVNAYQTPLTRTA